MGIRESPILVAFKTQQMGKGGGEWKLVLFPGCWPSGLPVWLEATAFSGQTGLFAGDHGARSRGLQRHLADVPVK